MYQEQQTIETGKTELIGEFYYSLALLQTQAVQYVANGKTDDVKLKRVQEIIELVKKTGAEIPDEDEGINVPHHRPDDCLLPCAWDRMLELCMCNSGELSPE